MRRTEQMKVNKHPLYVGKADLESPLGSVVVTRNTFSDDETLEGAVRGALGSREQTHLPKVTSLRILGPRSRERNGLPDLPLESLPEPGSSVLT